MLYLAVFLIGAFLAVIAWRRRNDLIGIRWVVPGAILVGVGLVGYFFAQCR